MQTSLKLDQIGIEEKFMLMEELWQELSNNANKNKISPKWHIELLNERELKVKNGESNFSDLSLVKKRLQKILNAN